MPGLPIIPEIVPRPSKTVFDKLGMSAFAGTQLDMVLRGLGMTSVAIIGVGLEIGIVPTVSPAEDLGYVPIVIVDACDSADLAARVRGFGSIESTMMSLTTDVETFRR